MNYWVQRWVTSSLLDVRTKSIPRGQWCKPVRPNITPTSQTNAIYHSKGFNGELVCLTRLLFTDLKIQVSLALVREPCFHWTMMDWGSWRRSRECCWSTYRGWHMQWFTWKSFQDYTIRLGKHIVRIECFHLCIPVCHQKAPCHDYPLESYMLQQKSKWNLRKCWCLMS